MFHVTCSWISTYWPLEQLGPGVFLHLLFGVVLFILWLNHTLCNVNNLYVCFEFIYVCNIDGNQPGILRNGMKPLPRQVLWISLKRYMNFYQYFFIICKITLKLYVTDLDHLMIDLISICFPVLNLKLIITIVESKLTRCVLDFTPILSTLWPLRVTNT